MAWRTTHRALVAHAAALMPAPKPTRVLGLDETRARRVRWLLEQPDSSDNADGARITVRCWKRGDPWMTSFVDADPDSPGLLLGLAPGRSGACVQDWLKEQTPEFRAAIELVVIDPSAPYASGARRALPGVGIAVDKWHLVRLANEMVTEVRQRLTRERYGYRGTRSVPSWRYRNMFLTGRNRLSRRQIARLRAVLAEDDPTNQLGAAWAVKERFRMLLVEHDPDRIRHLSGTASGSSTTPPAPTSPRSPGWPARSRPGGRPSWSP